MRKPTLSIGLLVAALAASSFAADPPVKAGGGFVPPSAKAPQKKQPAGLRFSVPYSFSNVDKNLKNAIIRCDVMAKGAPLFGGLGGGDLGTNLPQVGGNLPSSLGSGSVVIPLEGKPRNGAATIIPKPKPGASFDGATAFICLIQVNNGFETFAPGNDPKLPNWAKSQGGSRLAVSGPIK